MATLKKIDPAPPPPPEYQLTLTEDELQIILVAIGYVSPNLVSTKIGPGFKEKVMISLYNSIKGYKKGK